MNREKIKVSFMIILILLGIGLIVIGFLNSSKVSSNSLGVMIGLGAGMIGAAVAQLNTIRIYTKRPELLNKKVIEISDERNVLIKNKAKSKVYDIYNLIFPLAIFSLLIANVNPIVTIIIVLLYILRVILLTIYTNKYNNEM